MSRDGIIFRLSGAFAICHQGGTNRSHIVSAPQQRSSATVRCICIAQPDRYACATVRPSVLGRGVATDKWIVACAAVGPSIATAPAQISSAVVPHVARCRGEGQPWRTSRCVLAARTLHVCMCTEWHAVSGYLCMHLGRVGTQVIGAFE